MFIYRCSCSRVCRHHPRNDLGRLQRLAAHARTTFVSWPRALDPTAKRLMVSVVDAEAYVRGTVRQLADAMFVESVHMKDTWADVYGCYRNGLGWYVKIYESDDGLAVISHHEPERPLATIAKQVIYPVEPGGPGAAAINEGGNGHL
jgi:hypothetical protein